MNYSSLIADKDTAGSIRRWINWTPVDVEQIVEEAQSLIYQTMRVREMRGEEELNISVGDSYVALPTGFLDPLGLSARTSDGTRYHLRYVTEKTLDRYRYYNTSGVLESGFPAYWSIFDERINFNIKWEEAVTVSLLCYHRPSLLAATTNETNFLTDRYPHILRTACLAAAWDFKDDAEQYQRQLTKLGQLIENAAEKDDLSYRGIETDKDQE